MVQEGSCRILYASFPKQGADSSDVFLFGSHTGRPQLEGSPFLLMHFDQCIEAAAANTSDGPRVYLTHASSQQQQLLLALVPAWSPRLVRRELRWIYLLHPDDQCKL